MSQDLLKWQVEAGADEAIGETPVNRYKAAPPPQAAADPSGPAAEKPTAKPMVKLASTDDLAGSARAAAAGCATLEELRQAMAAFDGCALKTTAMNLVFADGNPESGLMFVGEVPGAEEDRQGLPFVGLSGQLLDRMLAAIGRDRSSAYIGNILPGNRKPTTAETLTCLPFIERHIELAATQVLVLLGGTSAATLLGRSEGITKLRGRWLTYHAGGTEIPALPTFHPAYLLRQPALKRESWKDFRAIRQRLDPEE